MSDRCQIHRWTLIPDHVTENTLQPADMTATMLRVMHICSESQRKDDKRTLSSHLHLRGTLLSLCLKFSLSCVLAIALVPWFLHSWIFALVPVVCRSPDLTLPVFDYLFCFTFWTCLPVLCNKLYYLHFHPPPASRLTVYTKLNCFI